MRIPTSTDPPSLDPDGLQGKLSIHDNETGERARGDASKVVAAEIFGLSGRTHIGSVGHRKTERHKISERIDHTDGAAGKRFPIGEHDRFSGLDQWTAKTVSIFAIRTPCRRCSVAYGVEARDCPVRRAHRGGSDVDEIADQFGIPSLRQSIGGHTGLSMFYPRHTVEQVCEPSKTMAKTCCCFVRSREAMAYLNPASSRSQRLYDS